MGVVAIKRVANQKAIDLLRAAIERLEKGETVEITLLEEGQDFSLRTDWTGSNDLLKVAGHLARMQYVVQKRMGQEYG